MPAERLADRIRAFIRRRGSPASSLLLAERFLKLLPPSEEIAARLLMPVLADSGLVHEPGIGWRRAGPNPTIPSSPPNFNGEVGRPTAPERIDGSRSSAPSGRSGTFPGAGSQRQVACAIDVQQGRIRGLCLLEVQRYEDDGAEEMLPRCIRALQFRKIAALLEGAEAVFIDSRREAPHLMAELSRRGLPMPATVRSLAAAVRGGGRIPRGAGIEAIASALGCGLRDGDNPADAAANIAACLISAHALQRAGERVRAAGQEVTERAERDGTRPSRARGCFTRPFLAAVPARPGVYRFYDMDGKLLYVGKAADLRRRLSTYAAVLESGAGGAGGAASRATKAMWRTARVEYEILGSELEALLKEARLISSRSPAANVQREVHERGRAYGAGRIQALLLPARDAGSISVVFVRDGMFEGAVTLGPRGGGAEEAGRILRRLFAARHDGARSARGRSVSASRERDTQILNSWIARHGERVSRVDLDSGIGPAAARRLLEEARLERSAWAGEPTIRRAAARRPGQDAAARAKTNS